MIIDNFDFEFILNNLGLLMLWLFSLYICIKIDKVAGGILFFSFFTGHLYKLVLVYTDQISFSVDGMNAPLWIHILQILSVLGQLLVTVGLWFLVKEKMKS